MRATETGEVLRIRAISGTYVVVLAWDFVEGQDAKKNGLMGFAIQREELQGDRVVERYWMTGIKRFRDKDKGLPPGTPSAPPIILCKPSNGPITPQRRVILTVTK